jgi:hypothetical protein
MFMRILRDAMGTEFDGLISTGANAASPVAAGICAFDADRLAAVSLAP